MDMKIEDILNYQLGENHPLRSNRNGMKAFAQLVRRLEACPDDEFRGYIDTIEKHLKKFAGCHCYIKMHLFLSIFCASHPGMSDKAKTYFDKAKEIQQGYYDRPGDEHNYFREVYDAIDEYGCHESEEEDSEGMEKWPLIEMGTIQLRPHINPDCGGGINI